MKILEAHKINHCSNAWPTDSINEESLTQNIEHI